MGTRDEIAWLYRRVGFGLAPGELDDLERIGTAGVIDRLVDPDAHGIPEAPDPWEAIEYHDFELNEFRGDDRQATVRAWAYAMRDTPRPLEEWVRWFWHGHLVSSMADVEDPQLMVQQLRLYGRLGLGNLRDLLYETTVDPAMLIYLDGRGSQKGSPNENYGRELLELFSLGIGNYTEDDIGAAAAALTGWRVQAARRQAVFDPRIHDDTPRTFLGATGVHDVDTVVDAVVGHEACPVWIARSLAEAVLGAGVDAGLVDELGRGFREDGLELRPLLRNILEAGVDGAGTPMILRPVPWAVGAIRATGAVVEGREREVGRSLNWMGQVPLYPPNVSGWPGDAAWLTSSATVGRFNTAAGLASLTPDGAPALAHAASGDHDALADLLGHPEGFGPATRAALDRAPDAGGPRGVAVLAVALASPELIQA